MESSTIERTELGEQTYDSFGAQAQAEGLPTAADDDGEALPVELVISGSGQLGFKVGGKQVTDSSLRLVGGKVEVEGSFAKGEIIVLRVEAVVSEIDFVDRVDSKTQQVTACSRVHKARVVSLRVEESHE